MTVKDAHSVHVSLAELEFPVVFQTSTFFALFKTYGIPSISKLLVATGQLSCPETASKRAADTATIMTEAIINKPDSERAISGIARMNYLHSRYIKAGKISNDDMLYTLSLFVLEPIRWTARYEWRTVTDFERCAMGVYWKDMGEAMKISYDTLPSAGQGWRDGFHWLEEVEAWSLAYETQNMVPADSNATLGRGTFDVALFNVPSALKPFSFTIAHMLLEPRLRKAMNIPQPPVNYYQALDIFVEIRKFLLRNFFLPRPYFLRPDWFTEIDERTGRAHAGQYIDRPWYVKPSFMKRWGPNASAGLGAQIARVFAPDFRVVINYSSNSDRANTLMKELSSIPGPSSTCTPRFHLIQADMSSKPSVQNLVQETISTMGRLDVVVSNAGWTRMTTFTDIEQQINDEDWDKCFTMNVKTHMWLAYAAKDALASTEGTFISTASVAGVKPSGSSVPYAVTKAAQIHLAKSLAVILAPRIRVNSISPGMLLTEWGLKFPEKKREAAIQNTKLKRLATVEDCAEQVRVLALSRSITGQNISIDGGSSV
ncbi:hypothetical protein J4E81_006165 [Alternaria sp. BMP 2799]|nr:hypothetical protein J4E81_006165 [Alternaria sp. BMP 2799]